MGEALKRNFWDRLWITLEIFESRGDRPWVTLVLGLIHPETHLDCHRERNWTCVYQCHYIGIQTLLSRQAKWQYAQSDFFSP